MRGSRKHRRDTTGASRRAGGRSVPLAVLLARLTRQRDPEVWTIHCRDGRGRRTTLLIGPTSNGITITATGSGPWQLALLESGRLRGAVREALLTLDQGAGTEPVSPGRRTAPREILIRERPGGRGPGPELAPLTGQPPPHQQPDPPVAASEVFPTATQLGRS